jgi:hypothetical protein
VRANGALAAGSSGGDRDGHGRELLHERDSQAAGGGGGTNTANKLISDRRRSRLRRSPI